MKKKDYVFLSHNGNYYEFRDLDKYNNRYFIKYFKNHKCKDVCGFVYTKGNMNMKRKYPIMNLCEGLT